MPLSYSGVSDTTLAISKIMIKTEFRMLIKYCFLIGKKFKLNDGLKNVAANDAERSDRSNEAVTLENEIKKSSK